jgi:NADPH-dependent ferric siderophore reductase
MPEDLAGLARTVPSRPAGDLDDDQMLAKAHGSLRWDFTVVEIGRVAARMLRLSLSAVGLEAMKWRPAQDLTILITRTDGRDIRRRYTIAGQDHGELYLDIFLHGRGIGSCWAQALRTGDAVTGVGPRGKFLLDSDADWMVLIGDETSLPGVRAMLAASDQPAQVIAEVEDPTQWRDLDFGTRADTKWMWVSREAVSDAPAEITIPRSGVGHAYVSGEASRVLLWRNELQRLGLAPSAVTYKAYWGAGGANATHGEPLD